MAGLYAALFMPPLILLGRGKQTIFNTEKSPYCPAAVPSKSQIFNSNFGRCCIKSTSKGILLFFILRCLLLVAPKKRLTF